MSKKAAAETTRPSPAPSVMMLLPKMPPSIKNNEQIADRDLDLPKHLADVRTYLKEITDYEKALTTTVKSLEDELEKPGAVPSASDTTFARTAVRRPSFDLVPFINKLPKTVQHSLFDNIVRYLKFDYTAYLKDLEGSKIPDYLAQAAKDANKSGECPKKVRVAEFSSDSTTYNLRIVSKNKS